MSDSAGKNEEGTMKRKRNDEDVPPEWLKETLECPVCFGVIRDSPIYLCEGAIGHSLCKACYRPLFEKRLPCPICRVKLLGRRSNLLEILVEKLPKGCKYRSCKFQNSNVKLLLKHEEDECFHRKIPCGLCDKRIAMSEFIHHVKFEHYFRQRQHQVDADNQFEYFGFEMFFNLNLQNLDEEGIGKGSIQFAYEVDVGTDVGIEFLINWRTASDQKCLIFWISNLGPKDEADWFKYSIKIKCDKGDLFGGTRHCVPCDISHAEMKDQQCGILIDKKLLQEAARDLDNQYVAYSIKIEYFSNE